MTSLLKNTGVPLVLLGATGLATTGTAAPFISQAWQARVKAGPLAIQRRHAQWARDQNGDFVDDAFNDLCPGDKTRVLVQLIDGIPPEDLGARFSACGDVVHTGVINSRTASITDLVDVRWGFGTSYEDPEWNPRRDVTPIGTISIADLVRVRGNFGAHAP